ncbi:cache domain-containing protein [Cellulosilyticum ruminicola]|uniref:cache domain-containing protein n=1 Tax=Cellulosilyticum ruminicola TaxID=425254 RepID=UPI0006D04483|nr:cache domain-containing protein [Cellulosilyticum ruminicola]
MNGEGYLTAPFVSKADGGLQISITAPIKQDGKVIGIVFFSKEAEKFSAITNDISFGKTGTAYVVDEHGTNIINQDIQKVIDGVNRIEDAKTNSAYAELAAVTGWSVGITTELDDMLSGLKGFSQGMTLSILIMLLGMSILSYIIAHGLAKRLGIIQEDVNRMASGEFTLDKKEFKVIDEITNIDMALQETKASVGKMIADLQESYEETMRQYDVIIKRNRTYW